LSSFRIRVSFGLLVSASVISPDSVFAQTPGTPVSAEKAAKDGRVWGALVFASDTKPDEAQQAPAEFPDLGKRLGKVFPQKHFTVLGEHSQAIFREYESWVVPSKDLFLKLDSKGATKNGGINMHLQFWQGQKVLVKTDAVLQRDSPLFIGGPKWRDGRLIFVLVLKTVETHPRK
jgi:hypothetical protein